MDPLARFEPDQLEELLMRGASGVYIHEASARLLLRHGYWLPRPEFVPFVALYGDPVDAIGIRWKEAVEALDAERLAGPPEAESVLRIGASICTFYKMCLREEIENLTQDSVEMVAEAVMYAASFLSSRAEARI